MLVFYEVTYRFLRCQCFNVRQDGKIVCTVHVHVMTAPAKVSAIHSSILEYVAVTTSCLHYHKHSKIKEGHESCVVTLFQTLSIQ